MTGSNGLPSTWHAIYSANGEMLYCRRQHTGYEVWPEFGRHSVYLDARRISQHDTLTHAIVAARDHMHANSNVPQQEIQR